MKTKTRNTGINVKQPTEKCDDKHCPFHSSFVVRGRTFIGIVTKNLATKTAQIKFQRLHKLPKYERYEKRRTKIQVHIPPCIKVKIGDTIKVMECRPISKTKNFVIVENESC